MDVFISWSEDKSHHVAEKLADWLPMILNPLKPWVSDYIVVGQAWLPALFQKLKETRVGILCLTEENLKSTWVHFEAGAVFKSVRQQSLVIPYLIDIEPHQLGSPISHITAIPANRDGTRKLLATLNNALPVKQRLSDRILDDRFKHYWKDLNRALNGVISGEGTQPVTAILNRAMAASDELCDTATRCRSLIISLERHLRSASVDLSDDPRTLRSSHEAAKRLSELVKPTNEPEFKRTLWWVSQRGSQVHLRALDLLLKSPPFGEGVRGLMKQARVDLDKNLSDVSRRAKGTQGTNIARRKKIS